MNLLETIKLHDAKMEATQQEAELLKQALMFLVDNLIDRDLTLCVEPGYMKHAYQILKDRGMMDSHRSTEFQNVQDGLCDQSVKIKHAVDALNNSYTF